jgi:hypothetical protein
MTAILTRALTIAAALWPASALSQAEHLTLKSWTACPTIEDTNNMLLVDHHSALCEPVKSGSRMLVEQIQQAPAMRWMCIDHPAGNGTVTFCSWHAFKDEPKTWLCARFPNTGGPCKWGPAEYFTSEALSAKGP